MVMFQRFLVLSLVLTACAAVAQTKKRTPVPAVVTTARYVAIVPLNANSQADWFNDTSVSAEDRAIADSVLAAIRSWGKYKYTIDPRNADIIIAVRAGRRAEVAAGPTIHSGGLQIGRPSPQERSIQPRLSLNSSMNVGPLDDTLAIFVGSNTEGAPLWMHRKNEGLKGKLPLFEEFRRDVEKSEQMLSEKH